MILLYKKGRTSPQLHEYSSQLPTYPCTACLQAHSTPDIAVAWVHALIVQYAGMSLADIRQIDEGLLPAFLASHYGKLSVSLHSVGSVGS
jgi:hypothetical protein